jgi:hypothetical protein
VPPTMMGLFLVAIVAIAAITITQVVKAIAPTRHGHGASPSELAQLKQHVEQLSAALGTREKRE